MSKIVVGLEVRVTGLEPIVMLLDQILRTLRLREPGRVRVRMVSEGENGMAKFVLVLPPKGAPDVVKRELRFSVDGGDEQSFEIDVQFGQEVLESPEFEAVEGATVTGTLVDIDDAKPVGLRSPASEFSVVLEDTIGPSAPGAVNSRMVSE